MVHIIKLLLVHDSRPREVIHILAGNSLAHVLGWDARVALIVARGHGAGLVRDGFALLESAGLFLGGFRAEGLLRDDALLVQCVVNCLGCANAALTTICISTLLFLVHILAQARLFFG